MAELPPLSPHTHRPFSSVEDYILGCTDEIWVDRGVGLINSDYYADDVVVHGAFGTSRGVAPVSEGTVQGISSYPDEVGFGEDVVWERRGLDSFVSSHRVYSTGTNTGWTAYGPPTARHFEKRALAHCLVRDGRIVEEWLVRDEYRLVMDLGHDPAELAHRLAAGRPWHPLELGDLTTSPIATGISGIRSSGPADDDCRRILDLVEHTWNQRRLDQVGTFHHPDIVLHTSRGRRMQGLRQWSTETLDLLSAFPDACMRVLDICAHDHPRHGQRLATVWLLEGTYSGYARHGAPTGQPIQLLGSSQYVIDDGKVLSEYRVYDELALKIQIEQGRLASS